TLSLHDALPISRSSWCRGAECEVMLRVPMLVLERDLRRSSAAKRDEARVQVRRGPPFDAHIHVDLEPTAPASLERAQESLPGRVVRTVTDSVEVRLDGKRVVHRAALNDDLRRRLERVEAQT